MLDGNDTLHWDKQLAAIRGAVNNRTNRRLGTSPASMLMGGIVDKRLDMNQQRDTALVGKFVQQSQHALIDFIQSYQTNPPHRDTELEDRIASRRALFQRVILPQIQARKNLQIQRDTKRNKQSGHKSQKLVPQVGDLVMIDNHARKSSMDPRKLGPYKVVRIKGRKYTIATEFDEELQRKFPLQQLYLTTSVVAQEDHGESIYEVDRILQHDGQRGRPDIKYLVKWKGYSNAFNEWLTSDKFADTTSIRDYWRKQERSNRVRNHLPTPPTVRPTQLGQQTSVRPPSPQQLLTKPPSQSGTMHGLRLSDSGSPHGCMVGRTPPHHRMHNGGGRSRAGGNGPAPALRRSGRCRKRPTRVPGLLYESS